MAFLAKKSWHTGTIQHMEKVWKAEERAKQEKKKMEELRRELAEERELDQLRKVQEKSSGSSRKERVDFLYQQPMGLAEVSAEEYLEGKRYTERGEDNEVKKIRDEPGALFLSNTGVATADIIMQDKRHKVREDPMFTIRKEEQRAKEKVKDNPLQMKRIREEVAKKKGKKHKRDKHKRRRESSDSDEEKPKKRRRSESPIRNNVWVEKSAASQVKVSETLSRDDREATHSENKESRKDFKTNRDVDKPTKSYSRKLTPEEKQKRLEEMKADAVQHEKERINEIKKAADDELAEKQQLLERAKSSELPKNSLAPDFISTLGREVYTDKSTASLQDRLQRSRFYVQRTDRKSVV